MVKTDTKRSKKLVSVRELERDRASMDVVSARARSEAANRAVQNQRELIEKEQREALGNSGTIDPNELQLTWACIEAAQEELKNRESLLEKAEENLQEKSAILMAAHRKVRQMEALLKKVVDEKSKLEGAKEQREIDDLATNREARK